MKNLFLVLLSTLFLSPFLSGCATFPSEKALPEEKVEQRWDEHQEELKELTSWHLKGRAAVTSGKEGGSVSVVWQQYDKENYQLEFYGILGHGRTEIASVDGRVKLYTREGPILISNDAEAVLYEYTGWYLPVEHLYYWVRGLPAPGAIESLQLNSEGYLSELKQSDWTIIYGDYALIEELWLPKRLTLKHPGNASHPALTVKWLSKDWEF